MALINLDLLRGRPFHILGGGGGPVSGFARKIIGYEESKKNQPVSERSKTKKYKGKASILFYFCNVSLASVSILN